jgi:hypothetical protein
MQVSITQQGRDEVQRFFREVPDALRAAVGDIALTLKNLARGRSPYKTGFFKRSWSDVTPLLAGGYSFENPAGYGDILEEGLYPRVGPRTVAHEGRIYSRQAIGGILGPMIEDETLVDRITDRVIEEFNRIAENQ